MPTSSSLKSSNPPSPHRRLTAAGGPLLPRQGLASGPEGRQARHPGHLQEGDETGIGRTGKQEKSKPRFDPAAEVAPVRAEDDWLPPPGD